MAKYILFTISNFQVYNVFLRYKNDVRGLGTEGSLSQVTLACHVLQMNMFETI